jgi:flagellar biosynthetic protein FliP
MKKATVVILLLIIFTGSAFAQQMTIPSVNIELGTAEGVSDVSVSLQILFALTVLSLAPAIIIMFTSFTRIIVVLSFVRNALATNQSPPNQVLIGLALFLTAFVMAPTWQQINDTALQPYLAEEISAQEALDNALVPIRSFMVANTRDQDLALFVNMYESDLPASTDEISTLTLVPAFIISELKTAFQLGFIIFIPFLVIDMVVASTLMSMGMMMLPPIMISLPFKILLFVMVDGWHLVVRSLLLGFQ